MHLLACVGVVVRWKVYVFMAISLVLFLDSYMSYRTAKKILASIKLDEVNAAR